MAETLEIVFTISQLGRTLQGIQQVERGIRGVNSAASAGSGGTVGGAGGSVFAGIGRLGTTVVALTAAMSALTAVVQRAAEAGRAFTDVRLAGGSSTAVTAQGVALGAGLGLSTTQTGSFAAQIRDAIAAGGFARSAASQLGVGQVLPRGLGGPNDLDVMLQLANGIRRITSEQEAYNTAIKLGAPELLRFRLLGEQQIQGIRNLGEEMRRTFSPEAQMRLARFQTEVQLLQARFVLDLFRLLDNVLKPFLGSDSDLHKAVDRLSGAMDANTTAVQSNTVAIGQMRQVFGGGNYARNALPAGLRGELLRQMGHEEIKRLGAF